MNSSVSPEYAICITEFNCSRRRWVVVKGVEQHLRKQGLQVKNVDLFELVLQLLDAKDYLEMVLQDEATWSKDSLLETLQNVAEPTKALVPKLMAALGDDSQISLITGSGRVYPFLRTHTILEALQPAMVRHPVVIFFPGEYSQDADGGSYLRLFGTSATTKIENPHYRATNLDYFDIPNPSNPTPTAHHATKTTKNPQNTLHPTKTNPNKRQNQPKPT